MIDARLGWLSSLIAEVADDDWYCSKDVLRQRYYAMFPSSPTARGKGNGAGKYLRRNLCTLHESGVIEVHDDDIRIVNWPRLNSLIERYQLRQVVHGP